MTALRERLAGLRHDDRGQVAGIEVLPFGFLIFVVGVLLLANAWAVVDAKLAVTAAAREAARTYVEAPDESTAATSSHAAALDALTGQRGGETLDLRISVDGGFRRCALVTAQVRVDVPAVGLPFIGGFGRTFEVAATHSEIVDPYRSGLPGEADCG
ncbi:hypothetical protein [Actinomarinicola tropica]|uniref:Pilus assembly protein n=1 Tax=Actinomarinicola tropica TaxID=2789776 RepID=A0A5Q2RR36_9ACTN|nr:hypothetical protein [Actinomarinicola tropica]QGG95655.1 hypothetical protein GH723_11420 [Actinomarinicola tropica]